MYEGCFMDATRAPRNGRRQANAGEACDSPCPDGAGAVTAAMKPEKTLLALAQLFRALGDPTRAAIVWALSRQELCVCDLTALLGVSQSAVSHSLRALRELRMVRHRKDGRIVYYALDDPHVTRLLEIAVEHVEEER